MPLARIGAKILFFAHIPKTGGASVELYLAAKGPLALKHPYRLQWSSTTAQHMHADVHRRLVPPDFCDHAFTVIRHPLERLKSEYRYRVDRGEASEGFDAWAMQRLKLVEADPQTEDNHIRPQVDFLRWKMVLFRYELGLDAVFDWIDAQTETPAGDRNLHKNASRPRQISISVPVMAEIERIYAWDFALHAAMVDLGVNALPYGHVYKAAVARLKGG